MVASELISLITGQFGPAITKQAVSNELKPRTAVVSPLKISPDVYNPLRSSTRIKDFDLSRMMKYGPTTYDEQRSDKTASEVNFGPLLSHTVVPFFTAIASEAITHYALGWRLDHANELAMALGTAPTLYDIYASKRGITPLSGSEIAGAARIAIFSNWAGVIAFNVIDSWLDKRPNSRDNFEISSIFPNLYIFPEGNHRDKQALAQTSSENRTTCNKELGKKLETANQYGKSSSRIPASSTMSARRIFSQTNY